MTTRKNNPWTLMWAAAFLVALGAEQGTAFAQAPVEEEPTEDEDLDQFWTDQRRVRVLENRLHEKDGDVGVTLYGGSIPNDSLLNYYMVGLRFGLFLSESVGLELSGSYLFGSHNEMARFIDEEQDSPLDIIDEQHWRADAVATWAPIYGKFSLLGRKLAHFDWTFSLGMGVVSTETTQLGPAGGLEQVTESAIKPEGVLGTGWIVWLTDRWTLRFDLRQFLFGETGGGVMAPAEITLGFGAFF